MTPGATRSRITWLVILRFHSITTLFVASLPAAALADPGGPKHFVWRVTNAPAPFYLIGSLHAVRASDYPLPSQIDSAFKGAQRVMFETNPEAKDASLFRRKLNAAGRYRHGLTIEQTVTPKTRAYLKQIAQVRESQYLDQKPWWIAFFMIEHPGVQEFNTRLSVDHYLYLKARGRMEMAGLESTDEFVGSLDQMSDRESEAFLLDALDYARRSPELLAATIVAWRTGNTAEMYHLYARFGPEDKRRGGYWRWLERRQINWMPRVDAAIRSGKATVVVAGALHFCGPRSVINMLRARGYRIEQL